MRLPLQLTILLRKWTDKPGLAVLIFLLSIGALGLSAFCFSLLNTVLKHPPPIEMTPFLERQSEPQFMVTMIFTGFFLVSLLLLFLACLNIGNLLQMHADRDLQRVLGAPRHTLAWQAFWEGAVIMSFGSMPAFLLAGLAIESLNNFISETFTYEYTILEMGPTTLAAILSLSLFATLTTGAPGIARALAHTEEVSLLKNEGQGGGNRLQITVQTTLISVLLFIGVVSALYFYPTGRIREPGSTDTLIAFFQANQPPSFYKEWRRSLLKDENIGEAVWLQDLGEQVVSIDETAVGAVSIMATDGQLSGLNIGLSQGDYLPQDGDTTQFALISQSLAGAWKVLPGHIIIIDETSYKIIGVVEEPETALPTVYLPLTVISPGTLTLYISHRGLEGGARKLLERGNPYRILSGTAYAKGEETAAILIQIITAAFALLSLLLAMTCAYKPAVAFITENGWVMGLQRALGAPDKQVIEGVTGHVFHSMFPGLVLSMLINLGIASLIRRIISIEWVALGLCVGVVSILMAAIAIGASWLPALRAVRDEPHASLRFPSKWSQL